MMNRLLVALAILSIVGCMRESTEKSASHYFVTANGPVEFEFPAGWHENEEEHPFDLQCLSKHQRMNTGVFLFAKEDLAEDLAPRELFGQQIEDLRSKRKNFRVVEEEHVVQRGGKTLTTVVYSGDKDSTRQYYKFTLIEFTENPELIPIILQVSIPSYWDQNKPVLEAIAASARIGSSNSQAYR